MANAASEAPASYVLATQLHDTVRELLTIAMGLMAIRAAADEDA